MGNSKCTSTSSSLWEPIQSYGGNPTNSQFSGAWAKICSIARRAWNLNLSCRIISRRLSPLLLLIRCISTLLSSVYVFGDIEFCEGQLCPHCTHRIHRQSNQLCYREPHPLRTLSLPQHSLPWSAQPPRVHVHIWTDAGKHLQCCILF